MPWMGFEPTISAGERPKTYALDRTATGTGYRKILRSTNKDQLRNLNRYFDNTKYRRFKRTQKVQAVPLQSSTAPEGSRRLRLQNFKTIGTCRW